MISGCLAPAAPRDGGQLGIGSMGQRVRRVARALALRVPAIQRAAEELAGYHPAFRFAPPGHFYSPLPSPDEVNRDWSRLFWPPPGALPGIKVNEAGQPALLDEIKHYDGALPFPLETSIEHRDFYEGPAYSYLRPHFPVLNEERRQPSSRGGMPDQPGGSGRWCPA